METYYKQTKSKGKQEHLHLSDKTNFKPTVVMSDIKGYYTLIKGTIHQEDIMIIKNMCTE
jgi:hypothetical protein